MKPSRRLGHVLSLIAGLLALTLACRTQDYSQTQTTGEAGDPTPVRLVVIDDPELAQAIKRQWQARAEREIVVRQLSAQELDTESAGTQSSAVQQAGARLSQTTKPAAVGELLDVLV